VDNAAVDRYPFFDFVVHILHGAILFEDQLARRSIWKNHVHDDTISLGVIVAS
jgi:hypothetical protein